MFGMWKKRRQLDNAIDDEGSRLAFEMMAIDLTRLMRQAEACDDGGALLSFMLAQWEAEARILADGDTGVRAAGG